MPARSIGMAMRWSMAITSTRWEVVAGERPNSAPIRSSISVGSIVAIVAIRSRILALAPTEFTPSMQGAKKWVVPMPSPRKYLATSSAAIRSTPWNIVHAMAAPWPAQPCCCATTRLSISPPVRAASLMLGFRMVRPFRFQAAIPTSASSMSVMALLTLLMKKGHSSTM